MPINRNDWIAGLVGIFLGIITTLIILGIRSQLL